MGNEAPIELEPKGFVIRPGIQITDDWEFFGRFGVGQIDKELGDDELMTGLGTRITIARKNWKDEKCSAALGFLAQADWMSAKKEYNVKDLEYDEFTMFNTTTDLQTILLALGVTGRNEWFALYGGPFVRWTSGEMKVQVSEVSVSMDIGRDADFGGYIGLTFGKKPIQFNIEYQGTLEWGYEYYEKKLRNDSSLIAASVIILF